MEIIWYCLGMCFMVFREGNSIVKYGVFDECFNVYGVKGFKVVDFFIVLDNVGVNIFIVVFIIGEKVVVFVVEDFGYFGEVLEMKVLDYYVLGENWFVS